MLSTPTPPTPCPFCGHNLDTTGSAYGEHRPKPGDTTICAGCAGVLKFGDDLRPRRPTSEETADMKADPRWPEVQRVIRELLRAKARHAKGG